jgi:dimethylglycine dehydrogenase
MQSVRDNEQVTIKNITDEWGNLVLAGPHSRNLLSKITDTDLSNEHFPWLTGKEIEAAGVIMRDLRINYVGELGWELHMPITQLTSVYNSVWAAGEEFGIADYGMYTLSSLGKEKAYYAWGVELINEIMMIEVGMERFVNFKKGDFVGREALLQLQKEQFDWNIAYVELDAEDADVRGGEPADDGDGVIGAATSGSYGHTVNKSLAFVSVPPEYAIPGTTFDIEILSHRRQAKVLAEAAYDPKNKRLRS